MAFVFTPEDGTGLAGANAYIDVAYADEYHVGRATAAWLDPAVTPAAKEAAIVRATDYIESLFAARFIGTPRLTTQGLSWPRVRAWLTGALMAGVPVGLKRATAEYAVRALAGPLAADGNDGAVVQESKTLGGISHSVSYAVAQGVARYPAADRLLRPLLRPACVERY